MVTSQLICGECTEVMRSLATASIDPFSGSGTTAKMAFAAGRNFIGCDISSEYCAIAEKRVAAAGGLCAVRTLDDSSIPAIEW